MVTSKCSARRDTAVWTAAWQRGRGWARLSVSALVPRRAPAGSGGPGSRGASTNEIHSFPHFGHMVAHCPRPQRQNWCNLLACLVISHKLLVPTEASRRQARAACLVFFFFSKSRSAWWSACIAKTGWKKSETTGSIGINLLEDYNTLYLCQSLLFFMRQEKDYPCLQSRLSLISALRRCGYLCFHSG